MLPTPTSERIMSRLHTYDPGWEDVRGATNPKFQSGNLVKSLLK